MAKTKYKKVEVITSNLPLDWLVAGICFCVGLTGFYVARSPDSWNPHLDIEEKAKQHSTAHIAKAHLEKHSESHSSADPYIPQILGPTSGAHFVSFNNDLERITLSWGRLPEGLNPQLEIHRMDDPEFQIRPTYLDSGAQLDLPDGTYQWRLRSINHKGRRSSWSDFHEFVIQEKTSLAEDRIYGKTARGENSGDTHVNPVDPDLEDENQLESLIKETPKESPSESRAEPHESTSPSTTSNTMQKKAMKAKKQASRTVASQSKKSNRKSVKKPESGSNRDKYSDVIHAAHERIEQILNSAQ